MSMRMRNRNCGNKVNTPDINIIGTRIAEGRKSLGFSQAQFADLLFVTPQAVGKWERSESLPDVFTLAKIGEIIGKTDICYFLGKDMCTCVSCDCCNKQ
jgi:transcriptional regulator with XRE-family HTH domain